MRRRVLGHVAPNTASSASVQMSKISVRSTSSRQPSRSNGHAMPASLTTISITGPSAPKPVSLSRQPLAVSASSYAQPSDRVSSCSVGSTRRGASQRTSLRSVGSCRNTWSRGPSILTGRSLSRSAWPQAVSGVTLAEGIRQAYSATRNTSYSGLNKQSLGNVGAHGAASSRCSQAASYSQVLHSSKLADRRSRELTTVLSSVDVDIKHAPRRATSRSAGLDYSQFRPPAKLSTIDMRPVSILPPQFESAFGSTSMSGTFDKYQAHRSFIHPGQAPGQFEGALSPSVLVPQSTSQGSLLSPGPFNARRSDSDPSTSKSHVQSPPENIQVKSDGATVSSPQAIEYKPLQPPTEQSKKTEENSPQPAAQQSPLSSIEFSQTRPIPEDLLTPPKALEFLHSPTKQLDSTSPPKPIEHLLNQPTFLGLSSPAKPIDFTSPQAMAVDLASPRRPIESSADQPTSLGLFSPEKPTDFTPSQLPTEGSKKTEENSTQPTAQLSPLSSIELSETRPIPEDSHTPLKALEFLRSPTMQLDSTSPPKPIEHSLNQPMSLGLFSPAKPIDFTPSQPPTEDSKKTENSPQPAALQSPLSSIEFSQTQPIPKDALSPPKALEFLRSPKMQHDLTSPPKPIEHSLNQPTSLGLFSPAKPIDFTPSQPTAVHLSSPPQPVGFSMDQPMTLSLASPPKPIEFVPSQPMAAGSPSPPRPIGSSMNQRLSLGFVSPTRPIESAPSPPTAVTISTPPPPIGYSGAQPMSIQLLSPPKPIELFNTQGLSLQVEAKPSEVTEYASPLRPVDASSNTATRLQLVTPQSPQLAGLSPTQPEAPHVEIGAFSPPAEANHPGATVLQINSSVPLQLQLLLTPPEVIEQQPDQTSPPGKGALDTTAAKPSSGPVTPVSAVLSPQSNASSLLNSQATNPTSSLQLLDSLNKEQADKSKAKQPPSLLFTPPTPVIKSQPRRPTMTDAAMGRRPSTKKF